VKLADPLGRVYAEALFSIARDRSQVEEVGGEIADLVELSRAHPEIGEFLATPVVESAAKVSVLGTAFEGRVSPLVADFVCLVVEKHRFGAFAQVVDAYRTMADEHAGRMRASVRSATALPAAVREEIASLLSREWGRRVELDAETDATLVGGAVVTVDDRVYDGSLRTRLSRFRTQLIRSESS
jgi:F-type H+-transporting ATPase subunit delta